MAEKPPRLKSIEEMTLAEVEALRLILRGDSVIDWHRLNIQTDEEALQFITSQEFLPHDAADRSRLENIKNEAIAFLRRHFDFAIPRYIENASPEELLLIASAKGHRQVCACTVLKGMHIIHHLDGRELLFMVPMSTQEIFQLVEEKVYREIGAMLAVGLPITEFIGGRKNKDSLYTKLLSKPETFAAAVYDKLRFRIVTRSVDDLLPVLNYLSQRLFPFNYVLPGESINTVFHFRRFCESHPHLRPMIPHFQVVADDGFTLSDNSFSSDSYRIMHFVIDMPIRLSAEVLERAPPHAWALGKTIFVLCEFQLIDRETEAANELGEASHAKYKERQRQAVARRLKLGSRTMKQPASTRKPPTK
jgi:uncharacterized protein (TIGR04552 family)